MREQFSVLIAPVKSAPLLGALLFITFCLDGIMTLIFGNITLGAIRLAIGTIGFVMTLGVFMIIDHNKAVHHLDK